MPVLPSEDALKLIRGRHAEWREMQRNWRFLADSYEGGHRYKMADYTIPPDVSGHAMPPVVGQGHSGASVGGFDVATSLPNVLAYGRMSDRNLVPHLSETDPDNQDVYALRLARTPVPKKLEMVVRRHLGRIFAREIQRDGGRTLQEWWADVDGCGTPIDKWMRKTVGPMLCVLGQLDLCFDHPEAPSGSRVETRADAKGLGLDRCVASYILPENMLDWGLDRTRRYEWCLVLERHCGHIRFRHWTAGDSVLYDVDGKVVRCDGVEQVHPHPFGRVPIVRVFDDRKPRCDNVGQSRYEPVADYQKAIYNGLSEQVLADVQQADPPLQGPEEYCQGEDAITVGTTSVLPMRKDQNGRGYAGWSYVEIPKGASADRRQHLLDFSDEIDRNAALTKPAGTTTDSTVAQSGISKAIDQQEGNDYLAEVSATLEDCEKTAAEFALLILGDGVIKDGDVAGLTVTYPREFGLSSGDDIAANLTDMHGLASSAGAMPETSKEYMKRKLRADLPGLPDQSRLELEKEIEELCDRQSELRDQAIEGMNTRPMDGLASSIAGVADTGELEASSLTSDYQASD